MQVVLALETLKITYVQLKWQHFKRKLCWCWW